MLTFKYLLLFFLGMVTEVLVAKDMKWKCINCGRCCHKIGDEFSLKLFNKKTENNKCLNLDEKNHCIIYSERPLGCKMYPFYPNWEKLKKGIVDFKIGSLKIDSECSGFMQGELIVDNVHIFKKLKKVSLQLNQNLRKQPLGKIKDLFSIN